MHILAIETTGEAASVALIDGEGNVTCEVSLERLNHLQNLMLMTEKLLEKSKLTIGDVSCIAVSEGPGSFTGIRIGVSTARALAQALNIKIVPVPTLKSFIYNTDHYNGLICPIFDARREQVYSGAYAWNKNGTEIIEEIQSGAYDIQEIFDQVEKYAVEKYTEIMFFGDGITIYEDQILKRSEKIIEMGLKVIFAPESIRFQNATSTAHMAIEMLKTNQAVDYENIKPEYIRKAEAQRKLEEGSLTSYK
jgi:tRNA threonylcarbamoyladenosine biosynthesis protein TsaB